MGMVSRQAASASRRSIVSSVRHMQRAPLQQYAVRRPAVHPRSPIPQPLKPETPGSDPEGLTPAYRFAFPSETMSSTSTLRSATSSLITGRKSLKCWLS